MGAKKVIPGKFEKEFVQLLRIRVYGGALDIARSQSFDDLQALSDFFEKMFGSAKMYYDFMGQLAKIRQGNNESVVVYLNRLKEIEKEIRRAAQKEQRIRDETTFGNEINKDCLKYFMRGLEWNIKHWMGIPQSYQESQERAIETERELTWSLLNRGQ